ncbi:hypothetical protein FA15DRAFT_658363 [Coprinopsis marcescibilis]|uniref:Uncharacterized protein n=1 Tax=Coprinopsis marcescibilis TaxID=230819 RepID=A0A5C3KLX7_COPMA|nr:hypothetical protein FA15DRAFT_658363 [Coprinopsis marcescibilis]
MRFTILSFVILWFALASFALPIGDRLTRRRLGLEESSTSNFKRANLIARSQRELELSLVTRGVWRSKVNALFNFGRKQQNIGPINSTPPPRPSLIPLPNSPGGPGTPTGFNGVVKAGVRPQARANGPRPMS